jgi:glutathione S-transferase
MGATMAAIQFYTNPMSRGQIARWMLHEAGADYDERLVAYGPDMQGEAYRAAKAIDEALIAAAKAAEAPAPAA